MKINGSYRRFSIVLAIIWIFFTLYPYPTAFGLSIYRIFDPPVNPEAVENLLPELPDPSNPSSIEEFVMEQYPYKYDWQAYNFPWYYPTAEEAAQNETGDCKTRFIILASIFESLSVPFELFVSPSHIWIHYAGKTETKIENREVALFLSDGEKFEVTFPKRFDFIRNFDNFWEAFFVHMPMHRKTILLTGVGFSLLLFILPPGASLLPALQDTKRRSKK